MPKIKIFGAKNRLCSPLKALHCRCFNDEREATWMPRGPKMVQNGPKNVFFTVFPYLKYVESSKMPEIREKLSG